MMLPFVLERLWLSLKVARATFNALGRYRLRHGDTLAVTTTYTGVRR